MKSLDYVQQPDGSFRWEMVDLDEAARTPAPAPVKPVRKTARKAVAEPVFTVELTETPDY